MEILKPLATVGLTQYEGQAYQALLRQSPLSAGDVSKIADIPPGKVYSVLENLAHKGFCLVIPGKRKRFSAVCPKAAVGGLIDARRQAAVEWEQEMTAAAEELDRRYQVRLNGSSSTDFLSVYTTPESMKTKFWELCLGSRLIRALNKPPYMPGTFSSAAHRDRRNMETLHQEGVEIRTIWEIDPDGAQDFVPMATACAGSGQTVRVSDHLPLKLHIFDEEAVLLTLSDHPFCRRMCYSLLITHAAHAAAMIQLFELHWERALPLERYARSVPPPVDARRTA